jgi:hypothetical protein
MSYQDHLKTCYYCNKNRGSQKVTISIKSASSYGKRKKLSELGAIIKGISYPSLEPIPMFQTKGASVVENNPRKSGPIERHIKLRELGKLVRG